MWQCANLLMCQFENVKIIIPLPVLFSPQSAVQMSDFTIFRPSTDENPCALSLPTFDFYYHNFYQGFLLKNAGWQFAS